MNLLLIALLSMPIAGKSQTESKLPPYRGVETRSGVDNFGYQYLSTQDGDAVTYDWIEISTTGTSLGLLDDDSATITLPFVFKLYNDTTSRIIVQSNGGVTFRNVMLSYHNNALPDTNGTMIAVYWSDQNPSSHGDVYWQAFGDSMVVIEWYEVPEYGDSVNYNTYEAVVYQDGKIKLQYNTIGAYGDETVGIQSKDAYSEGNGWYIQYVYNGTPQAHVPNDGTAILFYTLPPHEHDVGILNLYTIPEVAYVNDTVSVRTVVKNFGLNSEVFDVHFMIDTGNVILDSVVSTSLDTAQVETLSIDFPVATPGSYNVTSYTALSSDTDYTNDTAKTKFKCLSNMPLPYITDFESDSGYFYHGSDGTWQWGNAAYTHSGTKAWATVLNGNYPNSTEAYLYSYAIDLTSFSSVDSTYLTFWYLDSLETNYDFVYLLITKDRGQTWDTVRIYNGYSTEWQQEFVDLKPYNGNSIQFVFVLESDYSVNRAGFFFDDLKVGIPLDNDVGIRDINIQPEVTRPNDSVLIDVTVHNFGLNTQTYIPVITYILQGQDTVFWSSGTVPSLAQSQDTVLSYSFVPQDTGVYDVVSYTSLGTDEYTGNDTLKAYFTAGSPNIELSEYRIGGDGIADIGEDSVPLIVSLINNGARADSVSLHLETGSSDITLHNPDHFMGRMLYNEQKEDTFYFDVSSSATQSESVTFTLNITAENGYTTSNSLNVLIGGKLWTIMVLINGDNNLTSYGVSDVDEMEETGSNDQMNILVQFDGESNYSDSLGTHTDANRYYIGHHPGSNGMIDAYPLMNLGEVDMGDTSVIFDFFKWAVDNYPAKHYAFVIWDHGSGWVKGTVSRGVSHDETDNDYLSFAGGEARALFKKMSDYIGRNLDIVGYDVCLVQMIENIDEAYGYADNVVASEKSEPGDGWDYHFLQDVANNPAITPEQLASSIVSHYSQYYSSQNDVTLSAFRMNSAMRDLTGCMNNLAKELIKAGGINNSAVHNIVTSLDGEVESSYAPYEYFVDIKHFAMELKNANINQEINNVCDSIISLYDGGAFTINAWSSSDVSSSMYGISIMLPPSGESLDGWEAPYSGLLFSKQTLWYRFLMGDTTLPDTSHTMLNAAHFEVQGNFRDTLYLEDDGYLHLMLANYTNSVDTGIHIILSAPSFMTLGINDFRIDTVLSDSILEAGIWFSVAPNAPAGGFHVNVKIKGATYTDSYNVPFFIIPVSSVKEGKKDIGERLEFPRIVRLGSNIPLLLSVRETQRIGVSMYDIQGRKIAELFNGKLQEGTHKINLSTRDMSRQGIYFLMVKTKNKTYNSKILLVR